MENVTQFISSELFILLICTPIVGEVLKVSDHTNKIIPIALFVFDVVFSILLLRSISADVILQGIMVWGIAVAGYDSMKVIRQSRGV